MDPSQEPMPVMHALPTAQDEASETLVGRVPVGSGPEPGPRGDQAATGSEPARGSEPGSERHGEVHDDEYFPTLIDAPTSSSVRKEQVRAALFHKMEPVRVGRFILLERLGAGSMGEIYAAYDEKLDRRLALKLVRQGSEPTLNA